MPTYLYLCPECQSETSEYRAVDTRDDPQPCLQDDCPGTLQRQFTTQVNFETFGTIGLTESQFRQIEAGLAERQRL